MGCIETNKEPIYHIPIKIKKTGYKKDEIDVYEYESETERKKIFLHGPYFICPLCNQRFSKSEMEELEKIKIYDNARTLADYFNTIKKRVVDIFEQLEILAKKFEKEKNFVENPFYKHKCIPNNTEYYIKIYNHSYPDLKGYLKKFNYDERYHYDIWRNDIKIKKELLLARDNKFNPKFDWLKWDEHWQKEAQKRNEDDNKITSDGYFRGIKLCGRVQVVEHFPDFKVQVVEHFPDLKVEKVEHFPDSIGKWQFVEHFPDFKIEYVEHFPDFTIQFVEHFPGLP